MNKHSNHAYYQYEKGPPPYEIDQQPCSYCGTCWKEAKRLYNAYGYNASDFIERVGLLSNHNNNEPVVKIRLDLQTKGQTRFIEWYELHGSVA